MDNYSCVWKRTILSLHSLKIKTFSASCTELHSPERESYTGALESLKVEGKPAKSLNKDRLSCFSREVSTYRVREGNSAPIFFFFFFSEQMFRMPLGSKNLHTEEQALRWGWREWGVTRSRVHTHTSPLPVSLTHTYSIIFASSPPKETDPHHPSLPLSATPSALATTNRSSGSINLPISYISYTWNHETYNTCDWLLSHSTMFSRFIRVIERNHCFILLYGSTLPHCMAITLCLSNNQWTYVLFPLFSN